MPVETPWRRCALLGVFVLLAGMGAVGGGLVAWGEGLQRASGVPEGWIRQGPPPVPLADPRAYGDTGIGLPSWNLQNQALLAQRDPVEWIRIRARMVPGARLTVQLAAQVDGPPVGLVVGPEDVHSLGTDACDGSLPAPGLDPFDVEIRRTAQGIAATLGGAVLTCRARVPARGPRVGSDVLRVRILDLATSEGSPRPPLPVRRLAARAVIGALLVLLAGRLERRRGRTAGQVLATWAPVLFGAVVLPFEPALVASVLRIPALATPWLAAGTGGAAVVGFWIARALWRSTQRTGHPRIAALANVGVGVLLASGLAWVATIRSGIGLAAFGAAGAAAGMLLWANALRVRGFNVVSLAACAVLFAGLEVGARHTDAGRGWRAAWQAGGRPAGLAPEVCRPSQDLFENIQDSFVRLEEGVHTAYPTCGYPVALPARTAPFRIACFGGSSTAGYWRFDTLDRFYPARLEALLGTGVQVVNQGVGGWTTFHIRHYLERIAERLDADVATFYVGSNDACQRGSAPLEALWTRWQRHRRVLQVAGPLRRLALYQGLAAVLSGSRVVSPASMVTVAQARANLEDILGRLQPLGTRVVLIGEVRRGPPMPCDVRPYHGMMRELADPGAGVYWFDAKPVLAEEIPGLFEDEGHLSQAGHDRLAHALAGFLRDTGIAFPANDSAWTEAGGR
ncbi:MAG: SGNH/GDSL hydrolase family protein [Deltaproteobacteria bacterium]|nr:SGNH/GDSL hydrolase family protein [Deltaproteobacteria bacterium]